MSRIVVSSLNWALRHKRDFDAVLTLEDPDAKKRDCLRFHRHPRPDHLVLRFVDMDRPAPGIYADQSRFQLATEDDVSSILDFGRKHTGERLLVHCHAGVGRSTAAALAIIADRLGAGNEDIALADLLVIRPQAVPNLHVLTVADRLLGRGGALIDVVRRWDDQREANGDRRQRNRQAHFLYYGLPKSLADD